MRHFLKFLPPGKRTEAERQYQTPKPASAPAAPAPAKTTKPSAKAPPAAKPKKPVGPEFGGLIERRSRSREAPPAPSAPKAPKAPSASQDAQPRPVASRTQATEKSWDTRFDIDSNEIKAKLEEAARNSTGVFLASLDNSAITLADSGLYKLDDETETEQEEAPSSFNPYNHGWSNR